MLPDVYPNRGRYTPSAIYYHEADSLEYVRRDAPCVYRRIDEILTLVVDLNTREPLGFQFKGFRSFYIKHITPKYNFEHERFIEAISLIEEALTIAGDGIFSHAERSSAYQAAMKIADEDHVKVTDFPKVA
jgi:hypothetical protein